jgi:hypothetical protein
MKTTLAILLLLVVSLGAAPTTSDESPASVRFATVDVQIDAKGKPVAAYQVEFIADATQVKLVGIEGGDHAAFKQPPYYDPAALSKNRVIVAAFNTRSDLPKSSFRAARLHVQITGPVNEKPKWESKLIVAAAADGSAIPATVTLQEGVAP